MSKNQGDQMQFVYLELFFFTSHILQILNPRVNKPNIHSNIISISRFQNKLNDLFSSTGFYFMIKVIEGSHKQKK